MGRIWGQEWAIYKSSNGPYMGAAMGHACAHTWAIYGGSNGACMRAYMAIYGATWEQQWGMHARIYGHIWGHMGAAIGHIWGSPIGRAGRKGIIGNPFPSLVVPAPSLPLPSLLEGKGAGVIPFLSLPYSVAYEYILIIL
jgi:hypothetical protein